MAVTFVPCRDKEHAVECREACLLYVRFIGERYVLVNLPSQWVRYSYPPTTYGHYSAEDFAYAVED